MTNQEEKLAQRKAAMFAVPKVLQPYYDKEPIPTRLEQLGNTLEYGYDMAYFMQLENVNERSAKDAIEHKDYYKFVQHAIRLERPIGMNSVPLNKAKDIVDRTCGVCGEYDARNHVGKLCRKCSNEAERQLSISPARTKAVKEWLAANDYKYQAV